MTKIQNGFCHLDFGNSNLFRVSYFEFSPSMSFFSKKEKQRPLLGVDIGTGTVKVVKLEKYSDAKERGKLENYGMVKMRSFDQSHMGGLQILDAEGIKMLRLLLSRLHEETKEAAFSIPMYSAFVQEMILPPMLESELASAVEFEARSRIPVPIKDVNVRWELIEEPKEDARGLPHTQERHVLLIAVPNDIIFRYQNIAKEVGLTIHALEVEVFSTMRALNLNANEPVVILDIGARNTNIAFIKNGFLRLSHNIEKGGDGISQVIAQGMDIDIIRAEELKKKEGLAPSGASSALGGLVYPVVDNLIGEIRRVMELITPLLDGEKLKKVVLVGGTAQMKGLKEYFAVKINVPVEIANPWVGINCPPKLQNQWEQRALTFVAATGLALY